MENSPGNWFGLSDSDDDSFSYIFEGHVVHSSALKGGNSADRVIQEEYPHAILDMALAYRRSEVLMASVELGIFTELEKQKGAASEAVAKALRLNASTTHRLLRACVALGLLSMREEKFYNTDHAERYLTEGKKKTLLNLVKQQRNQMGAYRRLAQAVKEGSLIASAPLYDEDDCSEVSRYMYNDDQSRMAADHVVSVFDLSKFKSICDIGGGTGCIAMAIAKAHPKIAVKVLERPVMVKFMQDNSHLLAENIQYLAGDILQSAELPAAELYVLGHIACLYRPDVIENLYRKVFNNLPPGGAVLLLERLLDERPGEHSVHPYLNDMLDIVLTEGGRERTAQEYKVLLKSIGFDKVHYNIAKINADRNNVAYAVTKYKLAIELNPEYDQAMNNLGNIYKEQGKLVEAEKLLLQAVAIRPDFAAAWMNLGIAQASMKKSASAERSYVTALRHRRKYPDCYYNLGNLYLDLGRHEEALMAWRNATVQRPSHVSAWSNMIILLDNLGRMDDLAVVGREASHHLPSDATIQYNLGNAFGKAARYAEGEKHLLSAVKMAPKTATFHANLGVLYHRWGKLNAAAKAYEKALELEPDSKQTAENLELLKKRMVNRKG